MLHLQGTQPVLRLLGITKRFGPLVANDDITLHLHSGEVLALLGENGAGKSTLVSILFGHYTADSGSITAFGRPLPPGQPQAALAAGIGMVHQHSTLAQNLSVLDNIMLGTEPLWQPYRRRAAAQQRLLEVAQRFGLAVDPQALVGRLSVGEGQRVEILKALYRGARILILDEPTAVLTPQESDSLFGTLAQMVAQGLSIVFISHKLPEVLRVSHRVAVLRAGRLVAQACAADASAADLARWMVGRDVAPAAADARARACAGTATSTSSNTGSSSLNKTSAHPAAGELPVVCELLDVSTAAPPGRNGNSGATRDRLVAANLQLRAGEIVAIAGVSGNGQVALADVLCGTRTIGTGTVTLLGQALRCSPRWLVAQGVARIPEDRHGVGVVGDLAVWENAVSERITFRTFSRWHAVRRTAARAYAERLIKAFDVRGAGALAPARALSGGNMQKLILARALTAPDGRPPRLIVAHQPTWGLDVGAVAAVQAQLLAARDAQAAVLLISDDLDEVMALGDRIAVMHAGHLSAALPAAAWTRAALGLAMAGGPAPAAGVVDLSSTQAAHAR